jgi:hypothetical protein
MPRGGREEEEDKSREGLTGCDAVGNLQVAGRLLSEGTHEQRVPIFLATKGYAGDSFPRDSVVASSETIEAEQTRRVQRLGIGLSFQRQIPSASKQKNWTS